MKFRSIINLLCWEAVFSLMYETWIGPTYLSGMAGELGVSVGLVSVLAAIPWIGASGQIWGAWFFDRSPSVKQYVLRIAGAGRALWLIPLFLACFWGAKLKFSGAPFPVNAWFLIAAFSASVASLLTSASANAWMYWVKNLVPHRFHGRFFGARQRFTTLSFVVASLFAASIVGWAPEGFKLGYGVICSLAIFAGGLSILLLSKIKDVPRERTVEAHPRSFQEIILIPLRDREFRKLLIFGALFNGALQLPGPYFPYYFTSKLHIAMSSVVIWTALQSLGIFASSAFWGRRADQVNSLPQILRWTGMAMVISPLFYLSENAALIQIIGPIEYFFNGVMWSGFVIVQMKLLLKSGKQGPSSSYFSTFAAFSGLSGAIGAFLGGQIAGLLEFHGGFRALWVIGSAARLAVLLFAGINPS
jgi:Na+/melibiose symporter-like transporter